MNVKPLLKAVAAIAFTAAGTVPALAAYPERAIEFVVPSSPGGGTDVMARSFTDVARKYVAQPLVVTNKPGASGSIGMGEVQRAAPDGYKVSVLISELAIIPHLGMAKFTTPLVLMADRRLPGIYDQVPTFKERGVDLSVGTWRGLGVPIGTPAEVVQTLREMTRKTVQDPAFQEAMARNNLLLSYMEGEQFKPFMAAQSDYFKVLLGTVKIEK